MLKSLIQEALQQVLQTEMTDFLGASPGERSEGRSGYRAGYYRIASSREARFNLLVLWLAVNVFAGSLA